MNDSIDILKLTPEHQQALVCMFFAMLPNTDQRYKKRNEYWEILQKRFNKKVSTYKHAKDTFDFYFLNNNRKGWSDDRALATRGKQFQEVYDQFKDYSVDVIEKAVDEIMRLYRSDKSSFISMKCGFPEVVHSMLEGKNEIVIDGVYTLQEELEINRIVFITLGGDKGKKEVDWEPGFFGIGHIIKIPYEFGYNGNSKYFKFDIFVDCIFGQTYKREDFLNYRDAFDARYIGPELTRDPSQAISSLDDSKAVAVIRAVLDKQPDLRYKFEKIFPKEFIERVLGAVRIFIPTIAEYGESTEELINSMIRQETADVISMPDENKYIPLNYKTGICTEFDRNRIVFGAPGTGKSFRIKSDTETLLERMNAKVERVTFHSDYSYSQFVGTYKPITDENGGIKYEFVPGPFMRIYVEALKSGREMLQQPHVLVIEEINRARVATVFGDVFQLLDRDSNGVSEYDIQTTEDVRKYLAKELGGKPNNYTNMRLPDNMYIWATMNSADQGVFPMDTAFKRRWNFEYIGIDDGENDVSHYIIPVGMGDSRKYVNWNELRKGINDILTSDNCKVNEDKLLGPYFLSKNTLKNALINCKQEDSFVKLFESKVIMYLFEDVMKMKPQMVFKGYANNNSRMIFSEICKAFESDGELIFDLNLLNTELKGTEE